MADLETQDGALFSSQTSSGSLAVSGSYTIHSSMSEAIASACSSSAVGLARGPGSIMAGY